MLITLADGRCGRCKLSPTQTKFGLDKSRPNGLQSYCASCKAIRARERYASDREHRIKERQRWRIYYIANSTALNNKRTKWARDNRDKQNAAERRMHALHPEKWRVKWTKRRNLRRTDGLEYLLYDPCSYCGGISGEIDHINPISKGGDSEWTNLTSVCRFCNVKKSDKSLLEFLNDLN